MTGPWQELLPADPLPWLQESDEPDGTVTPRSIRKGFESFSFGQKKRPSAWATARVCTVLRRVDVLADEIAVVDVFSLSSSKGGAGVARSPRG